MLKVKKTQQDALGIDQGWQGNFTEAGGREIVGILHVSLDKAQLEYGRYAVNVLSCSLPRAAFRSEYAPLSIAKVRVRVECRTSHPDVCSMPCLIICTIAQPQCL